MEETDLQKLGKALTHLGIREVDDELTAGKAYDLLCVWKDNNSFHNEGLRLKDSFCKHELEPSWKDMCERRNDSNAKTSVSDDLLDYVVKSLDEEKKIRLFLRKLITARPEISSNVVKSRADLVKEAMKALVKWREGSGNVSQAIQMSLALERAKCNNLDRTFFKVPEHLLKAIPPQEVEGFVSRLTGRHCKRLADVVGITDEKIETIIDETNGQLFDTRSMVSDWLAGQECSNFEKRCRLDDAIIEIGRHDMTDSFGTVKHRLKPEDSLTGPHPDAKFFDFYSIFDDDLQVLLKHLPSNAKQLFLKEVGISVEEEGDDLKKLQGWRDKKIKESTKRSLQNLVSIHKEVLELNNDSEVLDVNDDELENIMESVTSTKQAEELTSRLGIKTKKGRSPLQHLKEWRDSVKRNERRQRLTATLHAMKLSGCIVDPLYPICVFEAETVRIAMTMLATDVEPLASLLSMDTSKVKTVHEPLKGTVGLLIRLFEKSKKIGTTCRRDFSIALGKIGYLDVARSASFGYGASLSELCSITSELSTEEMEKLICRLGLDTVVPSAGKEATSPYDRLELIKMWKNQLRPEPVHFRFKLAMGVRAIGRTDLAEDVLAGRFRTEEVRPDVVERICTRLDGQRVKEHCEHLKLDKKNPQDDQTTTTRVAEWVNNWLTEFDKLKLGDLWTKDKLISRVQANDELFRAGFFELAEESMLLSISVKQTKKKFEEPCSDDKSGVKPTSTECEETSSMSSEDDLKSSWPLQNMETSFGDKPEVKLVST